jgi:hypothetical protein
MQVTQSGSALAATMDGARATIVDGMQRLCTLCQQEGAGRPGVEDLREFKRTILLQVRARWDDAKSSLGDAKSLLGDAKSLLGDAKSSLGDAESSLGDAESSLGDAESSLGGAAVRGADPPDG